MQFNLLQQLFLTLARLSSARFFKRFWAGVDSNHRSRLTADLQSAPFSHSGTYPCLFNFQFSLLLLCAVLLVILPLMRFELTASPLPRECATPAPQGHVFSFHLSAPSGSASLSKNAQLFAFFSAESLRHKGMCFSFNERALGTVSHSPPARRCRLRASTHLVPSSSLIKLSLNSLDSGSAPQGHVFSFQLSAPSGSALTPRRLQK